MTVSELGERMSSYELQEWIAFHAYEIKLQKEAEAKAKRESGMRSRRRR